nr:F0F1 ATP synthase subunit B [uncultured Anaerotignum sp.]
MLTLNWNIIWTFVDLIVLYVLMKKFLFARVQKVLDQRQEMIQGQMDHAKEQEALANQNLQQAQETVENATKEAREKAQRILEAASRKEKEQLQASEEEAKRILISSRKQAEQERKKLLADTQDEMVTIAMLAARKAVGNNINEEKEKALFDDLLKKVGEA